MYECISDKIKKLNIISIPHQNLHTVYTDGKSEQVNNMYVSPKINKYIYKNYD